jgi:hypothetical protein
VTDRKTDILSSRERVRLALAHQTPDRVPIALICSGINEPTRGAVDASLRRERGVTLDAWLDGILDVVSVGAPYIGPALPAGVDIWGVRRETASSGCDDLVNVFDFFIKDERGTDPWGTTFVVDADVPTIGIPKEYPVRRAEDAETVRAPDPAAFAARTADALGRLSPEQRTKYRFVATSSGIWERVQYLRGMEHVMEDMCLQP